ncbi:MAG TPA: carboxypeptidase-like regulatory domain-containing protein, partial [Bryobacteraceae bacterium]|nr:carboxypeptidase-like regulatory domain-containing protein [Bryobacteraceae bacterium]
MKHPKLFPISVLLVALALPGVVCAQQTDPSNKPSVVVGNDRPKPTKPGTTRIIQGIVRDASDNPAAGAIVQLKNTRTAKVIDVITKDDGKYAFKELFLDVEYDLLAKRGDLITPVKKASPYDTRHD